MTAAIMLIVYLLILVFLCAVGIRAFYWLKMPIHLRWELYPVAHEGEKSKYGGSYLEETDWREKPIHKSIVSEIKYMVPEILLLWSVKKNNFPLWLRSFPFHFGLYLVIAASILLFAFSGFAEMSDGFIKSGAANFMNILIIFFGSIGMLSAFLGALGLLIFRLSSNELKSVTSIPDYINLVLFIFICGFSLLHIFIFDNNFQNTITVVRSLITFNFTEFSSLSADYNMTKTVVLLLSALLAYIPLTHMSHFFTKYFAYHHIKWEDEPNMPNSMLEKKINEMLAQNISWNGPHINGQGLKNWVEAAQEDRNK